MCHCLWVEYTCGCWRPACHHALPSSRHYHEPGSVWRTEHKAWQYCPAYLMAAASASAASSEASPSGEQDVEQAERRHGGAVEVPTTRSIDPRHGGKAPLCPDIRYETWRMNKLCPACREYLVRIRHPENLIRPSGGIESMA